MKFLVVLFGILLIIAGTALVTYQGLTLHYTTQDQKVLDLGPLEARTQAATGALRLPAVFGGIGLLAGVVVVFVASYWPRKKPRNAPQRVKETAPAGGQSA